MRTTFEFLSQALNLSNNNVTVLGEPSQPGQQCNPAQRAPFVAEQVTMLSLCFIQWTGYLIMFLMRNREHSSPGQIHYFIRRIGLACSTFQCLTWIDSRQVMDVYRGPLFPYLFSNLTGAMAAILGMCFVYFSVRLYMKMVGVHPGYRMSNVFGVLSMLLTCLAMVTAAVVERTNQYTAVGVWVISLALIGLIVISLWIAALLRIIQMMGGLYKTNVSNADVMSKIVRFRNLSLCMGLATLAVCVILVWFGVGYISSPAIPPATCEFHALDNATLYLAWVILVAPLVFTAQAERTAMVTVVVMPMEGSAAAAAAAVGNPKWSPKIGSVGSRFSSVEQPKLASSVPIHQPPRQQHSRGPETHSIVGSVSGAHRKIAFDQGPGTTLEQHPVIFEDDIGDVEDQLRFLQIQRMKIKAQQSSAGRGPVSSVVYSVGRNLMVSISPPSNMPPSNNFESRASVDHIV